MRRVIQDDTLVGWFVSAVTSGRLTFCLLTETKKIRTSWVYLINMPVMHMRHFVDRKLRKIINKSKRAEKSR